MIDKTVTYLCVVIDRATKKELASYEITDRDTIYFDSYYARHRAAAKFEEAAKYTPRLRNVDWCVDSVKLD